MPSNLSPLSIVNCQLSIVKFSIALFLALSGTSLQAQSGLYRLLSPDHKLAIEVATGAEVRWSVVNLNTQVLLPSEIGMELSSGEVLGRYAVVRKSQKISVNKNFATPLYKKSTVTDQYNELTLTFAGKYGLIFRAYNDGVAYRFFTRRKSMLTIRNEIAAFHFTADLTGLFPVIPEYRVPGDPFMSGFEALYRKTSLNGLTKDTLSFLPVMLNLEEGKKLAILEADLEDYPGMFLQPQKGSPNSLQAVFAGYPKAESLYRNNLNARVDERENFIAKVAGTRHFPWRVLLMSSADKELLNNDMMQKLASPSRVPDISWIRPGKVAWDWWNDWNVSHVDFKAGCNTATYKYYIDFAADYKLEYIILDESWSNDTNLLDVSPAVNLDSIIAYGSSRNVGVILWSTMYAVEKNTDSLFAHYSRMGVKGFKIDFLDRDDQQMVQRVFAVAAKAAKYKLVLDYHGMYKPSGLQRTFPNVLNCEGVRGLENYKWSHNSNVPEYDAQIPFIRMLAGPMDYTPGAMRNASESSFRPVNSMPMSQGTRCHQLAMYSLYEAPLQMLSDNPTAYRQDSLCTRFMAAFPTIFDETIAIDGTVGEFAVVARRKGNTWYVGALSNWTPRDLEIPLDFLGEGSFEAETFSDGINAERDGTDYVRQISTVQSTTSVHVHLAAGGGWAAVISKR
ncbi:MAG: glycoside hydrolase family 97 protein [Bacteroidota bacterium]|nr:glycoside hydrolase family 97 protein [Bacteroidota bacterium]